MFRVEDVYDEAKRIVGSCSDVILFRWLTDAINLIGNKADLEGWKAFVDLCVCGQCVTLPREVGTVIALNIGCHPALAYDQLFNFHLNGFGDCCTPCGYSWQDQGAWHTTQRDIVVPSKLVAYISSADDNGKKMIVFGYDNAGNRLRHQVSGQWRDGFLVPTIFGYAIPASTDPVVARITGIEKDITEYPVRLSTIDDSGTTGILLGVYEPDEVVPQYRRIKLHRNCGWVRIQYRKSNPSITSRFDHIPLHSRIALLCAVRAVKYYSDGMLGDATAYEATAARMELEIQMKLEPPTFMPAQVVDLNPLNDPHDYDIR